MPSIRRHVVRIRLVPKARTRAAGGSRKGRTAKRSLTGSACSRAMGRPGRAGRANLGSKCETRGREGCKRRRPIAAPWSLLSDLVRWFCRSPPTAMTQAVTSGTHEIVGYDLQCSIGPSVVESTKSEGKGGGGSDRQHSRLLPPLPLSLRAAATCDLSPGAKAGGCEADLRAFDDRRSDAAPYRELQLVLRPSAVAVGILAAASACGL